MCSSYSTIFMMAKLICRVILSKVFLRQQFSGSNMLSSDTGFQGQINLGNFETNKFNKFQSYKAPLVLMYMVNLGIERRKENTGSHSCKIAQHLPRLIAIEMLLSKDEMACPWQIKKIEASFSDSQFSFLLYCGSDPIILLWVCPEHKKKCSETQRTSKKYSFRTKQQTPYLQEHEYTHWTVAFTAHSLGDFDD